LDDVRQVVGPNLLPLFLAKISIRKRRSREWPSVRILSRTGFDGVNMNGVIFKCSVFWGFYKL